MFKRIIDLSIAITAICIFFIPIILIGLMIIITSSGPIIYWSRRLGRNDTIFMMPKFRTMQVNTPELATEKIVTPEKYLTLIGSFLRKSSLDEIPQLLSVLQGHMSIVGPRPALHNEYELIYNRKKLGINSLRPGITGWAQINGRDNILLSQKINFDKEYLNSQSIIFDLKIILLTLWRVVQKKDITY